MSDRERTAFDRRVTDQLSRHAAGARTLLVSSAPQLLQRLLSWACVPGGELVVTQRVRLDGEGCTAELSAYGGGYEAHLDVSCACLIALFDPTDAYHRAACEWAAETLTRTRTAAPPEASAASVPAAVES